MTEEQLNAHRDDFERAYATLRHWPIAAVNARREGDLYSHPEISVAWQAYCWALADVAKAAPVGDDKGTEK